MALLEKLVRIDRKIIFLTVFLSAALPLIFPFSQPIHVAGETEWFYASLDALEAGEVIILSMDYSPETRPELDPMSEALMRQCFHRGVKVIGMVNTIPNIPVGEDVMNRTARSVGAEYGVDYVYLGFKPQLRALIINFSDEIRKAFPVDYYGTPLDDLPMMVSVHSFDHMALAAAVTADDVSLEWLLTANTRFSVRIIMGIASNFYPSFTPYIESNQIEGALGGMKGAAEYEKLLLEKGIMDRLGGATKGMATQSSVHMLIILYILLGNIGYLAIRRKEKKTV